VISDAIDVTQPERSEPAAIVVVDDEPAVRTLVVRILERAGHRVIAFADGGAAIAGLIDPALDVDVLVTDLVMPGPSGIESARTIRAGRPGLPVVLMSGYPANTLCADGLDSDDIEVLGKPFSAADLLRRVAAALEGRPAPG
jgi:two-component system cell cycle sensor histidine kinase/response regulator CckA